MWQVTNHTPFAAMGYFMRDTQGVEHWVTAMRATFDLADGGLVRRADVQPPVQIVPVPHADDPQQLASEADIQPFRPQTDISLRGTAHAPTGTPVAAFPVTLRIGTLTKTLICHGPRILRKQRGKYQLEETSRIATLPLDWRHALGGPCHAAPDQPPTHPDNPVGMGWISDWARLPDGAELALPQITAQQNDIQPGYPLPPPQGFGVLQPHWQPRLRHAGTYDDSWKSTRHPRLPQDFDPRFYHAVLPDQRADLVGGEQVELLNLHPAGPIQFRLPQMIVAAHTEIGLRDHHTRLRLIAVEIDADAARVAMVFNDAIPCNGQDTQVRGTTLRIQQISGVAA